MMRRSVLAVLLKLHKNERHAVWLTAAAADTSCLGSRRSESVTCYGYRIFSLGGQGKDNGASPCYLAGGDKLAVSVGYGHIKIILMKSAGYKICVNRYRKPASAV